MSDLEKRFKTINAKVNLTALGVALLIFWLPVIVFARLANEVVERYPIPLDTVILDWLHARSSVSLDRFFLVFTNAGSAIGIIALTAIILTYLIKRKDYIYSVIVLFAVAGAAGTNYILKLLFHRQRPAFWPSIVNEYSYSFPSGHAMASSALVLAVVTISWQTRWRWYAVSIGGLCMLLVGISRLYFGVHFPTDIVAGWCVSLAWVVLVSSLVQNMPFALRDRLKHERKN